MNLIGSYQHHHLMHDTFPFVQARCHPGAAGHQDHSPASYFQSWVAVSNQTQADFHHLQGPAGGASYPAEFGGGVGGAPGVGAQHGMDDGLSSRMMHGGNHGNNNNSNNNNNKRRSASGGPKKERKRTESINTAFSELRECIPNVPADTKLSKIKTLRLATSYISYLMEVLAKDSTGDGGLSTEGFKAEIKKYDNRDMKRKREMNEGLQESLGNEKKFKGRTGWPQQVWALELNQ